MVQASCQILDAQTEGVLQAMAMPLSTGAEVEESGNSNNNNEDAVLKLKGLPYATTEAQVYEFFADYKVKTVAFVSEPDGRPSGLAFAEFESKEEALKALSRNGEYIGERYVRLLHVPKTEMEEQVRLGTLAIPGAAAKLRSKLLRTQMQQQVRLAAGGYLAGPQLLVHTPQVLMQAAAPGRPLLVHPHQHAAAAAAAAGQAATLLAASAGAYPATTNGAPLGSTAPLLDARTLWHNYPGAAAALPLHQQFASLGLGHSPTGQDAGGLIRAGAASAPGPFSLSLNTQLPLSSGTAASLGGGMTGGLATNGHAGHTLGGGGIMQQSVSSSGGSFGQQLLPGAGSSMAGAAAAGLSQLNNGMAGMAGMGCMGGGTPSVAARASLLSTTSATVKVRGLPYRSSPAEILGFFAGYQYLPDSLQLGLDASGRPSGEAWLTFASPAEAARAVRELNRHYLGTRYLELSVC